MTKIVWLSVFLFFCCFISDARAIAITSWTEDSSNIIITLASAAPSGNTLTYTWRGEFR